MASSQPPRVGEVGARTLWKSKAIPQLGLEANLEFEYRVYVLECRTPAGSRGPFYYVGIAHRSEVGKRIVQHFNAKGAFYTKANPPQDIHLIWPAAHTAVEGFVFLALLAGLPKDSVRRLGGWTQTSTSPSPLSSLVFEQERRAMRSLCFNCGGLHMAKHCPKDIEGVTYHCPSCSSKLVITSRGQSAIVKGSAAVKAAARTASLAPPVMQPPSRHTAALASQKRKATSAVISPVTKASRTVSGNAGKQACICGKRYSSISWFVGQANPSPSLCSRIRRDCYKNAVEMDGGQTRTLEMHGFAALPPAAPRELVPDRQRLSCAWVPTAITTDKAVVKVRKTGEAVEKCNSQVMWLISDLEKACNK